jgi:hypothetical protein
MIVRIAQQNGKGEISWSNPNTIPSRASIYPHIYTRSSYIHEPPHLRCPPPHPLTKSCTTLNPRPHPLTPLSEATTRSALILCGPSPLAPNWNYTHLHAHTHTHARASAQTVDGYNVISKTALHCGSKPWVVREGDKGSSQTSEVRFLRPLLSVSLRDK